MKHERWKPNVTVAAVIEEGGRFLLVEEETPLGPMFNNPAGHLDEGESPLEAVVREALEETGRAFTPEAFLGVYMARTGDTTWLRLAFCGRVGEPIAGRELDTGILRTLWMSPDELKARAERVRSPLVLQCLTDYLSGRRLPLDVLHIHPSLYARRPA